MNLSEKQTQVLDWLVKERSNSDRWLRPSDMNIPNFFGGAQGAGRASKVLFEAGLVETKGVDRGNGTTCTAYRAKARSGDNPSYDEAVLTPEAQLAADVKRLQAVEKRATHQGALDQLAACARMVDFMVHTDFPLAKPGLTYRDGYRDGIKNVANAIWARRKRLVAGEPEPELAALPPRAR